ncbi:MAG: metal-dependent hydrolase [Marinovum sp.]|nr:metal-dependent hydrolase [Marinovum sp.]
MIIGHLPAGYLLAKALRRPFDEDPVIFWGITAGAAAPDFDMLWFLFVDGGTVHHHTYITHDPTIWLGVLVLGMILARRSLIGLGIGAVFHLMLDTIVGTIEWGYGRLSFSGPLVEVPEAQSHWVLNCLLHWTFAVEIAITLSALGLLWWSMRTLG